MTVFIWMFRSICHVLLVVSFLLFLFCYSSSSASSSSSAVIPQMLIIPMHRMVFLIFSFFFSSLSSNSFINHLSVNAVLLSMLLATNTIQVVRNKAQSKWPMAVNNELLNVTIDAFRIGEEAAANIWNVLLHSLFLQLICEFVMNECVVRILSAIRLMDLEWKTVQLIYTHPCVHVFFFVFVWLCVVINQLIPWIFCSNHKNAAQLFNYINKGCWKLHDYRRNIHITHRAYAPKTFRMRIHGIGSNVLFYTFCWVSLHECVKRRASLKSWVLTDFQKTHLWFFPSKRRRQKNQTNKQKSKEYWVFVGS